MMIAKRKKWNLQGVLWYTWRDDTAEHRVVRLVRLGRAWSTSDLDAKPAWHAYTKLTGGKAN